MREIAIVRICRHAIAALDSIELHLIFVINLFMQKYVDF